MNIPSILGPGVLLLGRKWMADRWRQQARNLVDIGLVGEDETALFERS